MEYPKQNGVTLKLWIALKFPAPGYLKDIRRYHYRMIPHCFFDSMCRTKFLLRKSLIKQIQYRYTLPSFFFSKLHWKGVLKKKVQKSFSIILDLSPTESQLSTKNATIVIYQYYLFLQIQLIVTVFFSGRGMGVWSNFFWGEGGIRFCVFFNIPKKHFRLPQAKNLWIMEVVGEALSLPAPPEKIHTKRTARCIGLVYWKFFYQRCHILVSRFRNTNYTIWFLLKISFSLKHSTPHSPQGHAFAGQL